MINRTLVRCKVVQTAFAHLQNTSSLSIAKARKDLLNRFADVYDLYALLLLFSTEITTYGENTISEAINRARATHTNYTPNYRFVRNRWAEQVFQNRQLRQIVTDEHLSWEAGMEAVSAIYKEIIESRAYSDYMSADDSYENDKQIWRKIYTDILPDNTVLVTALDEMELRLDHQNWPTDLDYALSYVFKTVKQFREENGADQELLKMFDNDEELDFGQQLITDVLTHYEEYNVLIDKSLKNWDPDRIAWMDRIIMLVAISELVSQPAIAIEITMNEYIELAKEYSGDKDYLFINGILDEVVRELKRQEKIFK